MVGLQSKHLIVNPKLCTGCNLCELICSFTKFKVFNPRKSLIRVSYNYELGFLEGMTVCTQCGKCLEVCPTGSIHVVNEVIYVDHSTCIKCLACVNICPNNALVVINGIPYKCDLCGGNPQCVRFCVRGALNVS